MFNQSLLRYFISCFKFLLKCIDWRPFGFEKRNANDSTLWIGTKNAYTPCHYDSYGYNLVAQIYGTLVYLI